MVKELKEVKSEFSFSWTERAILAIAALKLGYQVFISDLSNSRTIGDISQKEYNRHSRWYLKQIHIFNKQLDGLKKVGEREVLPLERQARQIIENGILLSTNPNGSAQRHSSGFSS